ncbi:hypothetical protein KXQ82_01045 [Mucilaginibacter sp. HMF5004]|uniref:nucleotidyltransferase domain-containing protein n=1 Tax=Mucilaginibacter rivuli TaxID=2857527 RepID=UPI001C5D0C48|nr:hypothetical protein [Mucilaginibacter rivuli]MBW4888275.1 hypothetical protein [Mucilaginibacter rivuli]
MTDDLTEALNLLHNLLTPVSKNWMIIGSASLYLHGLPVKPHDVDILCSTETARAFEELLSAYRIKTKITAGKDKFTSQFSQYIINNTPVEVMGDLLVNTQAGWINLWEMIGVLQQIELADKTFLIPNIADQLKIYTLFGRDKDQAVLTMLNRG